MENLKRLSEVANNSKKPTSYVRAFRKALLAKKFRAVMLADKFKLSGIPKTAKPREVEDYAILDTPEFQQWHDSALTTLSTTAKGVPTFADIQAGRISLEEAEKITQDILEKKMQRNAAQNERAKKRRTTIEDSTESIP